MSTTQLRILQNNLHKNKERTHGILNDPDMKNYTILMLQEQYWFPYTKSSPIHHSWALFEPSIQNTERAPRAAIYVNKNQLPAAKISQLPMPSSDVVVIQISASQKPILLINIYNPCNESVLTTVHTYLQSLRNQDYEFIIMGGDFNCHHPMWNPQSYTRHDEEADTLVDLAADLGLSLMIPPGTITYPNAGTAIDLVWGNNPAVHNVLKCQIAENQDHGSDHLPIETILDINAEKTVLNEPGFNYAKANWDQFKNQLEMHISSTSFPKTCTTLADIDTYTEQLINVIQMAVKESTPIKKPSPHSKHWWNEQLTELRRQANRLRKVYRKTRNDIDREAWRRKANEYTKEIAKAKIAK